ncbi:hypothetical protein KHQ82_07490 [Mycoplasmatota bacterium]|nr:hypothetical protein KHQ82_07490 [Mycoplasmatota bacterium]
MRKKQDIEIVNRLNVTLFLFIFIFLMEITSGGVVEKIKEPIERHGNFLKVFDFYNGDVKTFFNIENEVPVFDTDRRIAYGDSEMKIYQEIATSDTTGVVVEISSDDVGNKVVVKGIDDKEYTYRNLFSVSVNIYDYVSLGDMLGVAFYDGDYYYSLSILDI